MPGLQALRDQIQDLVGRDRPEKAIELLIQSLKPDSTPAQEARMMEARYNRLQKEHRRLGIIDHATASQGYQNINQGLLDLLDVLLEDDLLTDLSGESAVSLQELERKILKAQGQGDIRNLSGLFALQGRPKEEPNLEEKLAEMEFDEEIGLWHRVNCDRRKTVEAFWDTFDRLENLPYQFYLVSACPTQMPPSFAERMVYELIREELDEEDDAIFFLRKENNARVRILDLPLKRKLERSQKKFKSEFCELFSFREGETFEHFIESGIPNLKYEYAVLLFEIHERSCKDHFIDFLEWLIQTFSHTHEDVPHFLFFVVVYVEDLHRPNARRGSKKQLVDGLQGLADQYESATHFQPLRPVAREDLVAWILDMGERNQAKVDELIQEFVRSLSNQEDRVQLEKEGTFNMDDIERLQDLICTYIEEEST